MYWEKLPFKRVKETVFEALGKNINYKDEVILGLPATYLDQEQFYFQAPFLKEAAFLSICHNGIQYCRGGHEKILSCHTIHR